MNRRHLVYSTLLALGLLLIACGKEDGAGGGQGGTGAGGTGGEDVAGGSGGTGGDGGTEPEPRCGDGRVDAGEECDDGNTAEGDGCSNACVSSCGDLAILPGVENCEDGNRVAGDGCSPACRLERGSCTAGQVEDLAEYRAGATRFLAVVTTFAAEDVSSPSCAVDDGEEVVFGLLVTERSHVELSTDGSQTDLDTVLSVRRGDCTLPSAEVACNDDAAPPASQATASRVALDEVPASTQLYVFVDGKRGRQGTVMLEAWVRPIVEEGEPCGRTGGPRCVTGLDCIGGVCGPIVCGDGTVSPGEECDPGSDPGCLADCRLPVCGDGVVEGLEACDDGNLDDTDGCTTDCRVPSCGDGIRTGGEECDDGSPDDDGDGCVACRLGCDAGAPAYRALPAAASCLVIPEGGRTPFWTASTACGLLGGHPITIDDAAENDVARRLAADENCWIGLSDGKSEGTFEWLFGTSEFLSWADGEPNDWGGNEDCGEIYASGKWNDNNCAARRRMLCELPLD